METMTSSMPAQPPRQLAAPPESAGAVEPYAGWEVDLPPGAVWWSDQALAILGRPPGAALSIAEIIGMCEQPLRERLGVMYEACVRDGQPLDADGVVDTGARRIGVHFCARAVRNGAGAIVRIQGALREAARPHAAGDDAPTLAGRLARTLDGMSEAFFTTDTALRFTYLNREAAQLLQRDRTELLGKLLWEEFPNAVGGASYHAYSQALRERRTISFEEFYAPLQTWFEVRCYATGDGLAVYFHDINEKKQARRALQQAHRALQMLSRCNHVVVHAASERELIDQVCAIAVDVGGYRMAWVGYAARDDAFAVEVAAHAGSDADLACLRTLPLRWVDDDDARGSPVGMALRSGRPVVVDDTARDGRFADSQAAAACGFCGAVFLPLQHGATLAGVLVLYAHGPLEADADEFRLLQELADNLAFGIHAIRARVEQARIQAAVTRIAASVSTPRGENFFKQLATTMAEAVGADAAFITRLLPTAPRKARSVIAVVDGERIADFDYLVADSPCAYVIDNEHYVVSHGADRLFPQAPAAMHAQAYAGWLLRSSAGKAIGIACVLFRQPVKHSEFVASTLRIFAARAAAELERQEADANLRTQASLLDKAQDAIIVRQGEDDRVVFWNKGAERMYGWTCAQAIGRPIGELLRIEPGLFAGARQATIEKGHWTGEADIAGKDGVALPVQARLSLIRDDAGAPEAILSITTDISERRAAERQIERLAFYDATTGLPNRLLLLDRLQHALAMAARRGGTGALLFIDLDNFKSINDTLGHDKGDLVLREVAARLLACACEVDTVARFGGDEFVILVENLSGQRQEAATQARSLGEKILGALGAPIALGQFVRHTTASIGVTLFDSQDCGASELLKQADLAMYEVKAAGRNGVRFFDPEMERVVATRAVLEADLRGAVERGEFVLHYQPQVDRDGALVGAEALLRWQSPTRALVAPGAFIGVAEDTALIVPIGRWVMECACAQLAHWALRADLCRLTIAVNVSARQLRHGGFVDDVLALLARYPDVAGRLKLEITESLLVDDTESTIATMHRLRERGIGFSLDDFGTGYSSLSYLKRLPLDQLKIDQSFVANVQVDASDAAIARTIMELGRCLRLNVIAEGVETAAQYQFLIEHGCHAFQGFLFSRAVPVDQFEQLARARGVAASPPTSGRQQGTY
jgi:diguanylate cyclase (GGDEF)-like protein/PAS domain S-box-containing protein